MVAEAYWGNKGKTTNSLTSSASNARTALSMLGRW